MGQSTHATGLGQTTGLPTSVDSNHPPISNPLPLHLIGRVWSAGVCMATLASPEVGLITVDTDKVGLIVDKDEECDKDSGHHSGEEMDCVINNESQASMSETNSRRNSFTEEVKSQMSSRKSSASSSRRQSSSSVIMSRRGSYSVVKEELEEERQSPQGVAEL